MKAKTIYMTILLLVLACLKTSAQLGYDIATLEAYIADHKAQRSLLLARSTLEHSNKLLHDYSRAASVQYKEINVELDKYSKAFDIIDLILNSFHTAVNGITTYNEVSDKLGKFRTLLSDFNDKCLKRGDIYSTDTLLVTVNLHMISVVHDEVENLALALASLVSYASGASSCTPADLLLVVGSMDGSMTNIRRAVNSAYWECWKYIRLRTSLWKPGVYQAKSKDEILEDAFDRWMESASVWGY